MLCIRRAGSLFGKHPSKIRNSGDKAKLISGNDESGFTYRGRFASKRSQAVSVGYVVSQKAHNAFEMADPETGIYTGWFSGGLLDGKPGYASSRHDEKIPYMPIRKWMI